MGGTKTFRKKIKGHKGKKAEQPVGDEYKKKKKPKAQGKEHQGQRSADNANTVSIYLG